MNTINTNVTYTNRPLSLQTFIGKYYYMVIGLFLLFAFGVNCFVKLIPTEYSGYFLVTAFASFTVLKDINVVSKLKPFLLLAIPFLITILIVLACGNVVWHNVLKFELDNTIFINLNDIFSKIPFNNASFARVFQPTWLTSYMQVVYNTGFILAVLIPLYRAALSTNLKKMFEYTLSTHIFQVFIITPFYFIFRLQEVWFVNGHPDMLVRNLSGITLIRTTLNCLPSMHTSVAFAVFILVLREKDKIFKFVWGFYCLSIIFSTMYLEIHWVIDVFGGLILGYFSVKLADYVIYRSSSFFSKRTIKTSPVISLENKI